MKLFAYSVYDRKALQYHPPFYASTDGSAVRSFSDLVQDPSTSVGRHPNDYVLYCVGSYDDATAWLEGLNPLRHVADASAFVRIQKDMFTNNSAEATVKEFQQANGAAT